METTDIIANIEKLRGRMLFSDIDIHFARFICSAAGTPDNHPLYLAAALVSNATVSRKHVGFALDSVSGDLNSYFRDLTGYDRETVRNLRATAAAVPVPEITAWHQELAKTAVVGKPGNFAPLILDHDLLYLQRYWKYEQMLGQNLRELLLNRGGIAYHGLHPDRLLSISPRFAAFAKQHPGELNWQAVAAFAAVRNAFTVITGGPGTGKTTVVAAILAMLRELDPELKIALCAPTGKAQARLKQAIREEISQLNCTQPLKESLAAIETYTIHRLLRVKYMTPHFRHDADHPLDVDVLVVDEASMVPLTLMTKLLAAITPKTRVILLGDKDQLASVESGAVLNDLCAAAGINLFSPSFSHDFHTAGGHAAAANQLPAAAVDSRFIDCAVALQRNYRFAPDKGIGLVKSAINELPENPPDALCRQILSMIETDATGEISARDLPDFANGVLDRAIAELLKKPLIDGRISFESYLRAPDITEAYRIFNSFKILCSHHVGMYGVENINRLAEVALGRHGGERFYPGRPVIIRENQHPRRLYNGDIGLIWPDEAGRLRAFFPDYEEDGGFRQFNPLQLPRHETVYAMTVHQAQGSGFQNIAMILPNDENSPILTRELIYTGITRAMKSAELWYKPAALIKALQRRTARVGGLSRILTNVKINEQSIF